MTAEQKQRAAKLLKKLGVCFAVGLIYLIFVLLTGRRIPCIFHELLGIYCPGCGITRMCMALARLDFRAAAGHNLLAFCLLPFALALGAKKAAEHIKTGTTRDTKAEKIAYMAALVLFAVFTLLRNMPQFVCLAP